MSSETKPKSAKKRVYHVPSRYKQASDTTLLSFQERTHKSNSKEVSKNSSQDTSNNSLGCQGMTSTPACKGTFNFPPLDASAVTDAQGQLTIPSIKERAVPVKSPSAKKNLMKQKMLDTTISRGPVIVSHKKGNDSVNKFNEKIASAEMDILYAQYLQSVFLEQRAKMALEARSQAAVETLHKLMTLVTQHLHKVKSRKVLLKVLTIVTKWNEHCQKQHAILKPVFEIIPSLEEKYKNLAEAIKATKHKLLVKDVILPDSDVIQKSLLQINDFITSFFEAVPSYSTVISLSDNLQKYVECGELLTEELQRGVSLLTEAQDLYLTEASLALG